MSSLDMLLGVQVMTAMREATLRDDAVPALPRLRTTDRELQHLVAVRHSRHDCRKLLNQTGSVLRQRKSIAFGRFACRTPVSPRAR